MANGSPRWCLVVTQPSQLGVECGRSRLLTDSIELQRRVFEWRITGLVEIGCGHLERVRLADLVFLVALLPADASRRSIEQVAVEGVAFLVVVLSRDGYSLVGLFPSLGVAVDVAGCGVGGTSGLC